MTIKYKKIYFYFLLLFLISTSIYRIDFGFGKFSAKITPPILTSFFLSLIFMFDILKKRKFISLYKDTLLTYIIALTTVFSVSIFLNINFFGFLQMKRFFLFIFVLVSAYIFIYLFSSLSQNEKCNLLSKFIDISLVIYTIFCIGEIYFFLQGKFFSTEDNKYLYNFISFYPQSIAYFFPRLSGGFIDPNLASYYLTFLFFLSLLFNKRRSAFFIFVLLLFTLSRSGIAGFLLGVLFYTFFKNLIFPPKLKFKIASLFKINNLIKIISLIILIMSFISFFIYLFKETDILIALSNRFGSDLHSGSGKIHLELISYALLKLNKILPLLIGYGFNSSYIFAQIFFPGNKYANFHSEYITTFFEEGAIGFIIYFSIYLIILYSLIFRKSNPKVKMAVFSILISFITFNIFYQQFIFFYYWVGLFLAFHLLNTGAIRCNVVKMGDNTKCK